MLDDALSHVDTHTEEEILQGLRGYMRDRTTIMIAHRTSLTFVNWAHDTLDVHAGDRMSSHAPFHFDLSIFDIFVTIKAGATVVLIPEMLAIFPRNLAELIEQQRISVWYSVPSALTDVPASEPAASSTEEEEA